MIIFLTLCYGALVYGLIRLKVVPDNLLVRFSPLAFYVLLLIFLFIPLQWGAPSGSAIVLRHSVQIVPNVGGQVVEVAVEPNRPVDAGAVLFRIDPTQYQARVDQLAAQLQLAELRLEQFTELERRNAGNRFQVQEASANARMLRAQLADAQWLLDHTTIRAPFRGFATAIALRPGTRVAASPLSPVMAFIDTSEIVFAAQILQAYVRHIMPGDEVEVTFKALPGQIFRARVATVLPALSEGQLSVSGLAASPRSVSPLPFIVRMELEGHPRLRDIPAGAMADVAIYTSSVSATHLIRRIMIRMRAWMNYVIPF